MDGTNVYEYQSTNKDGYPASDYWNTARADYFDKQRRTPTAPWLETPTFGILKGTVKNGQEFLDGVPVSLSNGASGTIKTDGTGFYAFLKIDSETNYSATASYKGADITKSFNITSGKVTTLDFDFSKQILTVASDYDSPVPPVSDNDFSPGTPINAFVTDPIVQGTPGTRYVCTGWTGTGSVPDTGTSTSVSFVINEPSSITWNWKTQYQVNTDSNPSDAGTITLENGITPAAGWYDIGTFIQVLAIPFTYYKFDYWDNDLSGNENPAGLYIYSPKHITANFSLTGGPTPTPTPTPTPSPTPIPLPLNKNSMLFY